MPWPLYMLSSPPLTSPPLLLWLPPAHPPMSAPQDNLSSSPHPLLYPVIDCVPLVTMMVLHLSLWLFIIIFWLTQRIGQHGSGNCVCLCLPSSPRVQQSSWNTGAQQPFAEWVSVNEHPPLWTSAGSKLVCSVSCLVFLPLPLHYPSLQASVS